MPLCFNRDFVCTAVLPFARQPETYEPISAHIGQTVKLPCQTNLSAGVDWWNLENRTSPQRYVLAGGYVQNAFRPRFNVAGASDKGDYTLFIFNVQRNDTAFYICIEDNGFGNSHGYQLIVSGILSTTTVVFIAVGLYSCCSSLDV